MKTIDKEELLELRKNYPSGTRIKLLRMDDPQAPLKGTEGTVNGVDDTGSLLVSWDSGGSLNVLYEVDKVEKIQTSDV